MLSHSENSCAVASGPNPMSLGNGNYAGTRFAPRSARFEIVHQDSSEGRWYVANHDDREMCCSDGHHTRRGAVAHCNHLIDEGRWTRES
jgi:hypothetical protein